MGLYGSEVYQEGEISFSYYMRTFENETRNENQILIQLILNEKVRIKMRMLERSNN
jgi:hypothetical protein